MYPNIYNWAEGGVCPSMHLGKGYVSQHVIGQMVCDKRCVTRGMCVTGVCADGDQRCTPKPGCVPLKQAVCMPLKCILVSYILVCLFITGDLP